jgi:hypothetical protein
MDYGRYPTNNDSVFPETPVYEMWSSATHGYSISPAGSAWVADYSGGFLYNKEKYQTDPEDDEYEFVTVRCVRGGPLQARILDIFVVEGDRVVEVGPNGLMWQGCAKGLSGADCETGVPTTSTWAESLDYCDGLSWAGYEDWRLPSVMELASITSSRFDNPAVDLSVFPETPSSQDFWSSSSRYGSYWDNRAYNVNSRWGMVFYYVKSGAGNVRCVRDLT